MAGRRRRILAHLSNCNQSKKLYWEGVRVHLKKVLRLLLISANFLVIPAQLHVSKILSVLDTEEVLISSAFSIFCSLVSTQGGEQLR